MSSATDFDIMVHVPPREPVAAVAVTNLDRVLHTADDRPDTATLPPLPDPAADHAPDAADGRRAEVELKQRNVIAWLEANRYDALVLCRSDSLAWFTAGGEMDRDLGSERGSVMVFINRNCRAVLCDNIQSARVFEEEVSGLGFQLKECPWHEDAERLIGELGHNRRLAADAPLPGCVVEREALRELRLCLTKRERQLIRVLGRTVTLAVEATCRNFMPGETEADVAGHLSHRLIREGVVPVDLRVASDDRLDRYRKAKYKSAPIHHRATISVVGRRHGLCVGVTRTVSFGPVDSAFRRAHNLAEMVDATCLYFTRPGETVTGVFRRAKRIYEKFGSPDEWMLDDQGGLAGYSPCERLFRPDSEMAFAPEMVTRWTPSVGPARCEDTVVVDDRGYEVVTEAQNWPRNEVLVKGYSMSRPGVLERPARG